MALRVAVVRTPVAVPVPPTAAPAWMGESERARWTRLNTGARAAFAAGRALLRELLEAATSVPARDWSVSAEPGRPPRASAPGLAADAPCVSLSHRLGWVAAAVSGAPVGVDVEWMRPSRSEPAERAELILAPQERPAWDALPPAERESALLARWTAKEAWFKAAPLHEAVWDFRRLVARAGAPGHANVRVWRAASLHLAICSADARSLAEVGCEGIDPAHATSSFWHVGQA